LREGKETEIRWRHRERHIERRKAEDRLAKGCVFNITRLAVASFVIITRQKNYVSYTSLISPSNQRIYIKRGQD
jgi:hypothetical protein